MNTIYFNPHKDKWLCLLNSGEIKKRECLFIILESRKFSIFPTSRSHNRITLFPHIYHEDTTYPIRIGSFTNTDKDKGFTNGLILRITN